MLKFGHRTQNMHPDFEESSKLGTVKLQTIIPIHEKINSTNVNLIIQGPVSVITRNTVKSTVFCTDSFSQMKNSSLKITFVCLCQETICQYILKNWLLVLY